LDLSAVAVEVKRALLFSSRAFYLLLFVGGIVFSLAAASSSFDDETSRMRSASSQ
jgi:hypothetical protein